uniref:Mannosyltransferase n=1 Tax=Plectus sambesii TaxID=2011161 RepID=A0A914WUL7_9BILA
MTKNLSLVRRSNNRVKPTKAAKSPTPEYDQPSTSSEDAERRRRQEAADTGKLYFESSHKDDDWAPTTATIFKILVSIRMSAGIWSTISDCDEVYNYWEPLHLLLYGGGFQTWEYSPLYAIRSYLYVWLHLFPAFPFQALLPHTKVTTFFFLRCSIGFFNALADLYLYLAICRRLGKGVGRLYAVFTTFATGMFIASCAFLPSSFSMTLSTVALAAYLDRKWFISVLATAASALVGWPFAAVLGLPVVVEMLLLKRHLAAKFVLYAGACGIALVALLVAVDSHYYGKTVLAPLNIVLYNVFSEHGPNLYGVEPASYYVKNLLLNWNVAVALAVLGLPVSAFVYRSKRPANWDRFLPVLLPFLSGALWVAIFFSQPHKEERFLSPMYPLISMFAALGLDAVYRYGNWKLRKLEAMWNGLVLGTLALFVIVSLSRSAALHKNYHAPIDAYMALSEKLTKDANESGVRLPSSIRVCVGKEWYRYPSSFFLPHVLGNSKVRLDFIKSEFAGLLPKRFENAPLPQATRLIPTEMNDMNREEVGRYVPVNSCDYLIDLETPDSTLLEPNFADKPTEWRSIHKEKFLLAQHSHPLYRAFLFPGLSQQHCRFGWYHVFERIKPPVTTSKI